MSTIKPGDISNLSPGLQQFIRENREPKENSKSNKKSKEDKNKDKANKKREKFLNKALTTKLSNKRVLRKEPRQTLRMPTGNVGSLLQARNLYFK